MKRVQKVWVVVIFILCLFWTNWYREIPLESQKGGGIRGEGGKIRGEKELIRVLYQLNRNLRQNSKILVKNEKILLKLLSHLQPTVSLAGLVH